MPHAEHQSKASETRDDPSVERGDGKAGSDVRELNLVRAALRQVPLFADMSDADFDDLASAASLVSYAKNTFIFRHGDPGDSFFVIVFGLVEIAIERDASEPMLLRTLRSGEFFGEMSLFDDSKRSADARAVPEVRLLRVERNQLFAAAGDRDHGGALGARAQGRQRIEQFDRQVIARRAHALGERSSLELDTIRQFYMRTQQVATETLERAEARAAELL